MGEQNASGEIEEAKAAAGAVNSKRPDRWTVGPTHFHLRRQYDCAIEECFGWLKTIAGLDRSRTVGRWKLQQMLEIGAAAFNLVRLRTLKPA